MTPIGAVLAFVVGLSLGMLGAGGSVLTVPIFVYVLRIPAKSAIAMSLGVVAASALIGAGMHIRHRAIRPRIALAFGIFAVIGAFGGARIARLIPEDVQLALFGIVVLTSSVLMLRNARRQQPPPSPSSGALAPRAIAILAVVGLGVGVLTAIIGVGGGFLIVPALVLLCQLPMAQAVATSLLIIAANAASGFIGYLGQVPIDWNVVGWFIAIAAAGTFAGSGLAHRVPQARLKQIFALLLLGVGVYVLARR